MPGLFRTQRRFQNELQHVIDVAQANGTNADPVMRQRLAEAWIGLRIMCCNALRTLSYGDGSELSREWGRPNGVVPLLSLGPPKGERVRHVQGQSPRQLHRRA